jgi:hypothetical protein
MIKLSKPEETSLPEVTITCNIARYEPEMLVMSQCTRNKS